MTKGIDVSHHNCDDPGKSPIDWGKVAAITVPNEPVRFAMIKITEGVTVQDAFGAINVQGASAAGIPFGCYHFAHPGDNAAVDEAGNFYNTYATLGQTANFQYPFALDLEYNNGLSPDGYLAWVQTFLTAFQSNFAGPVYPYILIYGSPNFLKTNLPAGHPLGAKYPLWIAHPNAATPTIPPGWTDYAVWQFNWNNSIDGIVGDVDAN